MKEKPKEFYLELGCEGIDSDGNVFMQCDMYFEKRNEEDVHLIEYSAYDKLRAEVERLKQCCKDFEFVLEGSRAENGQSDALLEKREDALMRALDWNRK